MANSPAYGHGTKGMLLLFPDQHPEYVTYRKLNPTQSSGGQPVFNFQWTDEGLSGRDVLR